MENSHNIQVEFVRTRRDIRILLFVVSAIFTAVICGMFLVSATVQVIPPKGALIVGLISLAICGSRVILSERNFLGSLLQGSSNPKADGLESGTIGGSPLLGAVLECVPACLIPALALTSLFLSKNYQSTTWTLIPAIAAAIMIPVTFWTTASVCSRFGISSDIVRQKD
jgi:branched-subunit amino acid transport protein